MFNHDNYLFFYSLFVMGVGLVVTLICLGAIQKSSARFLSVLFVESPKSPTGARLLGGLALSLGIITSMLLLLKNKSLLPPEECSLIAAFIISVIIITMAGYIDDKVEIRARHKLLLQLISVSFLTFQAAQFLGDKNLVLAYVMVTCVGFLLVNGTNLLDGLDTLAIKTSSAISSAFIFLGFISQSPLTILLSCSTIGSLIAFYFYNRAPARIYLGEIGGSLLGLIFTAQTILCYQHLRTTQVAFSAMSLVLITVLLPIAELGISFLRRVYFNKSPFKGDKLHLHYILKTKNKLSSNAITNVMGAGNVILLVSGFTIAHFSSPVLALVSISILYGLIYIRYCYSEWAKGNKTNSNSHALAELQSKTIYLINSSDLDRISFKIIKDENRIINKDKDKDNFSNNQVA